MSELMKLSFILNFSLEIWNFFLYLYFYQGVPNKDMCQFWLLWCQLFHVISTYPATSRIKKTYVKCAR